MKLLIDLTTFSTTHCGGKDEVAYNLLRGFSRLGYASQIICVCRPELREVIERIDSSYEIAELERQSFTSARDMLRRPGALLRWLQSSALYGRRLERIVRQRQAKLVFYTNKYPAMRRLPCKTVFLPHDIQAVILLKERRVLNSLSTVSSALLYLTVPFCDRMIAISDYDRQAMLRHFPKYADRIDRIYNPIRFSENKLAPKRDYITAINIQWAHKNTETLVRAYGELADRVEEKLVLVGRPCELEGVQRAIAEAVKTYGLEDRVIFTGFVDDGKMEEIISRTRLYVNPSLFEGFGMTAVEMMGSGIPTIVANSSASPETTLGLCRYYEPPKDYKALAAVMLDELEHPTEEKTLSEIAARVREEFDYIHIAQRYWTYLNEVAES